MSNLARALPPVAPLGSDAASRRADMLRTAFGVRGAWNLAFVVYLIARAPSTFPSVTSAFAVFALVDGLCAFLLAAVAARANAPRAGLWPVLVVDGIVRVAAALVVLLGPGLPYFTLTLVLYVLVAATLAIATGLLEVAASGRLHRGQAWTSRSVALGVTGAVTAALGAAAIGMDPHPGELRVLLIIGALVHGGALLVAATRAPSIPAHRAPIAGARA